MSSATVGVGSGESDSVVAVVADSVCSSLDSPGCEKASKDRKPSSKFVCCWYLSSRDVPLDGGLVSCDARLDKSDADAREEMEKLGAGDGTLSLCCACSLCSPSGGGVYANRVLDDGGDVPRNNDDDAGDDFREL